MHKYAFLLLISSIVSITSLQASWLLQEDEDETTTQLNQRNAVGTTFSDNDSDEDYEDALENSSDDEYEDVVGNDSDNEDDQTFLSVRMTA